MFSQLNYSLTLTTIFASALAALITFSFIRRIYTAQPSQKKVLLVIFSMVVGTGIWINHILLSLALHHDTSILYNPINLMAGWLVTLVIGFGAVNNTSKRDVILSSFIRDSALASIAVLGLFTFIRPSATVMMFDYFITPIILTFSAFVIFVMLMALASMKKYVGNSHLFIKALSALGISLGTVALHIAYNSTFISNTIIAHDPTHVNEQLIGIIIALAFISLFLLLFIGNLIFEKYGKQAFKFNGQVKNTAFNLESMKDSLTNLPNRKAFDLHIDSVVKRSVRTGNTFALAYIDLDHFKPVNDYHGHNIGDKILIDVADRLNTAVRDCDYVARIGGDEFVAIIEDIESDNDVTLVASRIVNSIKNYFVVDNLKIEISCSVGIAIHTKDSDIQKLTACADAAMYKAKEEGKNQFKFYDAEIESASDLMLQLQSDLCLAIEKKEFRLVFLPKISTKTMTVIGAEALIRWEHPTKGELLPGQFLPAAERLGLITEIGEWVLDECCSVIAYARQYDIDLNISINLPIQQFLKANFVKSILKSIKFYDISTKNLSFEIKESLAINNQEKFKVILSQFKEAGLQVVLDDFGLQAISLTHLQKLNVDGIKIDRSFIADISQDKPSNAVIEALIKLGHALGFSIVGEGVENEYQLNILMQLGCDYLQGYLFSSPLAMDALLEYFKNTESNQLRLGLDDGPQPALTSSYLTGSA